jgi:hypothetical protein
MLGGLAEILTHPLVQIVINGLEKAGECLRVCPLLERAHRLLEQVFIKILQLLNMSALLTTFDILSAARSDLRGLT